MKKHKYREEIQNRTISPSPDSWEKLAAKLDETDQKSKRHNWPFMKIASVLLIGISIGFYFYQPKEKAIHLPEVVSPTVKEEFIQNPQLKTETETEVATTSIEPSSKQQDETMAIKDDKEISIAAQTEPIVTSSKQDFNRLAETLQDTTTISMVAANTDSIEAADLDNEIDQLLHESKIKLIYNGEITSKKLVNSNALLNAVEDDLDKSLKERLIEKITATLKKDKEVATSKEN